MRDSEQQLTYAQTDTIELSTQSKAQFQTNFHAVYKNKADLCAEKKKIRSNGPQVPALAKEKKQLFCSKAQYKPERAAVGNNCRCHCPS